jgi:hypothetical protein
MPRYLTGCDADGCEATVPGHKFGHIKAQQEQGWFFERNGNAWCPKHHPAWVEGWRKKQAEKKEKEESD